MKGDLRLRNRQRARTVDVRLLRRALTHMLTELPEAGEFDITIHLVNALTMARLNEKHLQHTGPTDVITLDYADKNELAGLTGEIFICVNVAANQARRFRTSWPLELARYAIHGILHLAGHDDRRPAARRRMKQAENRWLNKLDRRFRLSKLARKPRLAP